jgi:phosphoribosylformimino-5-aminoimidazole carboxamide ribotide isomerase
VQIFPAIDLRGGQCVRLRQGDYAQETVFGADPAAMARRWVLEGATYLHLVDLDGARGGHPVNAAAIRGIVRTSDVPCQLGGGIRTEDDIRLALSWGVARVIVGTQALKDPTWLRSMCAAHPGRVVVGIDAKGGMVATAGWLDVSEKPALDFACEIARSCSGWPPAAVVYTDIATDGMLAGPNVGAMREMAAAVPLPVIASGGVTGADDVRRLREAGLSGCIIGRALYEGKIELKDALAAAVT